ncbi:hypothetical protein BLS_009336 [Venturia inaequalis]|uniref:Cell wall galactomannoprotein n=1 Tax=Venturia inaequalis TaxID=5025 RepID=A0A8H3U572_VENIN|nr:hypothetical protein BLS_009336 [Venturia inaequalis]KAE9973737.1 hypothetical protein EG327_008993 [Venturia inaequalis]RDI89385.1 hypothetical protein Vi05172_g841 [Venturia inaequalis]
MLFKSTLMVGFATLALAAPAREITSEYQGHLSMIDLTETFDHLFTALDAMTVHVTKFSGDMAGVDLIVADAAILQKAITKGAAQIKASPTMGVPDIINILGPVTVMQSQVGGIVDELGKQKDAITKAGGKDKIKTALQTEKDAADGLVASIKANLPLPAMTGQVAGPIAATITNELVRGVKEWTK